MYKDEAMMTTEFDTQSPQPDTRLVKLECPRDVSAEVRELAGSILGLKAGTVAMMAIRAGLPLVRAQLAASVTQAAKGLAPTTP